MVLIRLMTLALFKSMNMPVLIPCHFYAREGKDNAKKSSMHSCPVVKEGDRLKVYRQKTARSPLQQDRGHR